MNIAGGVCYLLAVNFLLGRVTLGYRAKSNRITSVPLTGLDCRKPLGVTYSYLQDVCKEVKPESDPSSEGIMILQEVMVRETTAYRCERRASTFTLYCGAYSHQKFFSPPAVEVLEEITPAKCREISSSGHFSTEDGRSIPVILNGEAIYTHIKHGTIYSGNTVNNVYCTGAEVMLDGEVRGGVLQLVTVKIRVDKIRVEVKADAIIDLDNHQAVPSACQSEDSCGTAIVSYYIPGKAAKCNLARVRRTLAQPVQIKTARGVHTALVDHQHKILLPLEDKMDVNPGCTSFVQEVWNTPYPELKVVRNIEDTLPDSLYLSTMEELGASSVDLDLEMKISLGYLEHYFHLEMTARLRNFGKSLCGLESNRLTSTELSPFQKHSLMRTRGDLMQEIRCKPVKLTANLGEKRHDFCIRDALPVTLGFEKVYISSPHHIVLEANEIVPIPCNSTHLPVFVSTDQKTLVQADPVVRKARLRVEHLELANLGELNFEEEEYVGSLLYTEEEIKKLENLISFGRVREKALHTVVDSFCDSGNCGSYQPVGQLSQGFSFARVQEEIESPLHWLESAWLSHLERVGSYCGLVGGIIFLTYCLWKTSMWIYILAKETRSQQRGNDTDLKIGLSVTNYMPKADEPARLPDEENLAARPQEPAQKQYPRKYPELPPDLEDEDDSSSLG